MMAETTLDVAVIVADIAHLSSFILSIGAIIKKKSVAGWSGRMQILHLFVFTARYWELMTLYFTLYNCLVGLSWILLSGVLLCLIYIKYRKTYEKSYDTFWIESIILGSLAIAFIACDDYTPEHVMWLFSRFVESVAILPQYYHVYQRGYKEGLVTYYVISLFYFRLFSLGHWYSCYLTRGEDFDPYLLYPALVQILSYFIYLLIPKGSKLVERGASGDVESASSQSTIRRRPVFLTQASLLETPLLKRSATCSSSIYLIGTDNSTTSTLERNQRGTTGRLSDEGRY